MIEQCQGGKMMKNWKRISGCLLAAMLPGCAIAKNEVAGNGDRKKVEIFPEVQMHYNAGNNFRNYWYWNDHPLFLDRTVRHPETALYMTAKGVHKEAQLVTRYGLSGLSPLGNSGTEGAREMIRLFAENPVPGFLFLPATFAPTNQNALKNLKDICSIADSPYVFRINGKMVINSYEAAFLPPERWKTLLSELRSTYGDKFLFVADMKTICQRYRYRRPMEDDPEAYDRKTMNEIQSYLDVADGIGFYPYSYKLDPDGAYGQHIDDEMGKQLRSLFRRVFADPRNKGKILACDCAIGYVNPQSGQLTPDEAGTATLRHTVEAALEMNPDYIIPFEWNEWNENTGVIPTVRKGAAAMRILRYYRMKHNESRLTPLPFDNVRIPNLILSCRAVVKLGEQIHYELLNLPDGSGKGEIKAVLKIYDADGKCVKAFPETVFDPARLEAKDFHIASENYPDNLILRPELTVTANGITRVYNAFPPTVLRTSHNIDYLYTRLPLREYEDAAGTFTVEKLKDGFYRIRGKVKASSELNTLEVMERHTEAGAIEVKPEFDRSKEEVFRVACSSYGWVPVLGTVTVPGMPETVGRNWYVGGNHNYVLKSAPTPGGVRLDVTSGGHGTRSVLLAVPRGKAANAEITVNMKQGSLKFRIADVLKYGSVSAELEPAMFWRVERVVSEPDIPFSLNRREMEFDTIVRSESRYPVFSLRAVTLGGKRWQSAPVIPEKPAGKKISLPVYSDTEREAVSVDVFETLVPDAVYTFTPASGRMLTTPWKQEWAAEIGGGYRYNLNNMKRHFGKEVRRTGPVWKHTEKDGDFLRFTKYSSLTFLPDVWPLGAFTFDCEIRPDSDNCVLLRHSNSNQTSSVGFFIVKGKLTIGHVNTAGEFRLTETPLEVRKGEWNRIRISSNLTRFHATVNGTYWRGTVSGRGRIASGLVIGTDSCRDFMPSRDFPDFTGDMRSLRISHKFEK